MVAPSMDQSQVLQLISTALVARLGMMLIHEARVFVRVERDPALRTCVALELEEFPSASGLYLR